MPITPDEPFDLLEDLSVAAAARATRVALSLLGPTLRCRTYTCEEFSTNETVSLELGRVTERIQDFVNDRTTDKETVAHLIGQLVGFVAQVVDWDGSAEDEPDDLHDLLLAYGSATIADIIEHSLAGDNPHYQEAALAVLGRLADGAELISEEDIT